MHAANDEKETATATATTTAAAAAAAGQHAWQLEVRHLAAASYS